MRVRRIQEQEGSEEEVRRSLRPRQPTITAKDVRTEFKRPYPDRRDGLRKEKPAERASA